MLHLPEALNLFQDCLAFAGERILLLRLFKRLAFQLIELLNGQHIHIAELSNRPLGCDNAVLNLGKTQFALNLLLDRTLHLGNLGSQCRRLFIERGNLHHTAFHIALERSDSELCFICCFLYAGTFAGKRFQFSGECL